MKKVFVLGSINVDYVMAAPRMPQEGETMHGDGFFINGGGKGANQAVAAARYGALKRELARRFPADRKSYTAGKAALIAELLAEAREWMRGSAAR